MNERELPADAPARGGLKSLLKKPGQTRSKSHKNRVVINEKLNEFFAADYIILIKEECCADYEEECDCCCQEPEMIRLGNCKECRADLTRHLNVNGPASVDQRYAGHDTRNGETIVSGLDCDPASTPTIRRDYRQQAFGSEESQEEDDEDEDDEEDEEEISESEDSAEEADKCDGEQNCNMPNCVTPSRIQQQQQLQRPQQQQETLSPPEGYKDVCDEEAALGGDQQQQQQGRLVCGECNYYHRQRTAATSADETDDGKVEPADVNGKEIVKPDENNDQQTSDQAQQTTPDVHQRYLVETITMTTVTERRIVREISEEETRAVSSTEADVQNANEPIENGNSTEEKKVAGEESERVRFDESAPRSVEENDNATSNDQHQSTEQENNQSASQREGSDPSELSLSFKLGNVSLDMTNSLKPNSAVRQLFPDPRFISPPPAPTKGVVALSGTLDSASDSEPNSEAQKFLITTESLRLFDAVKRSKMAGSRSDSSESESSSIKRTIERNALRRSLICKYETSSRKKNLRSKDLTLEERIRQLTCVDQDDDNTGGSSASETGVPTATTTTTMTSVDAVDYDAEFPVRTSPSGEERPNKNDSRACASRVTVGTNNVHETTSSTTTTTLVQQSGVNTHHHHHHHHQSTYKRITDLFAQKKMADANLPDLGLGDKAALAKEYSSKSSMTKMNSDARKQFLASLAPLSCVASAGVDSREDYYQLSSKHLTGAGVGGVSGSRDSMVYNSDSSYSLEDIEAALRGEERNCKNAGGPPDVTRGTPTGNGPEPGDATTDELLAFVEQDKSRTERIRRRYNDTDQEPVYSSSVCHRSDDASTAGGITLATGDHASNPEDETATNNGSANEIEDDDDDELNDYGFNRRPSVRGIKPQFESSSEIVRQLRSRSAVPSSIAEKARASFHGASWPYYEITGETSSDKQSSTTFLLAGPALPLEELDQRSINSDCQHRDNNTINRINTMQKQIDDIYQTIAETAVTVQGTLERGSYLESTLPRIVVRGAVNDSCHRYSHQEQLSHGQKNGAIHYHDQQQQQQQQIPIPGGRMLRIAGGGDGAPGSNSAVYNTLPTKSRRPQAVAIANYPCSLSTSPQPQHSVGETTKCYRTMYLVPYNGITDPTYQNIQRILPPHNSANYANHIERYPYARNARVLDQASIMQQHQQNQLSPQPQLQQQQQQQQQPRYYARTVTGVSGNGTPTSIHNQPAALHLHLHPQSEDYRFAGTGAPIQHPLQQQNLQIQHHQHLPQMASYSGVQTLPGYSVLPPSRPNPPPGAVGSAYAYPLHPAGRTGAADVQTQTMSITPSSAGSTTTCGSALLGTGYNGTANHHGNSSSSSNSSALSSPTKIQQLQQRNSTCNVAERGVPEGAASAPSQDYAQTNTSASLTSHPIGNSFVGHASNVPPPNTQNSVYYAMNV